MNTKNKNYMFHIRLCQPANFICTQLTASQNVKLTTWSWSYTQHCGIYTMPEKKSTAFCIQQIQIIKNNLNIPF